MIIKNLSYKTILTDISFELNQGSICAILGENGSGKSTLLKTLSGYYMDYQGDISLNQQNLKEISLLELYKTRAVLTQNNHLHNFILCKDYLELGGYNSETSDQHAIIMRETCEVLKITHLLEKDYLQCSGGEQQRMNLARVFIQAQLNLSKEYQPYLFLDEPFNHLDVKHIPILVQQLQEFKKSGFSIMVILHDINLAYQICDQALFLKQGKIVAYGDKESTFNINNLYLTFDIPFEEILTTHGERYFKS